MESGSTREETNQRPVSGGDSAAAGCCAAPSPSSPSNEPMWPPRGCDFGHFSPSSGCGPTMAGFLSDHRFHILMGMSGLTAAVGVTWTLIPDTMSGVVSVGLVGSSPSSSLALVVPSTTCPARLRSNTARPHSTRAPVNCSRLRGTSPRCSLLLSSHSASIPSPTPHCSASQGLVSGAFCALAQEDNQV